MENETTTVEETPSLSREVATAFAISAGTAVGMVVGGYVAFTVKAKVDAYKEARKAKKLQVVK